MFYFSCKKKLDARRKSRRNERGGNGARRFAHWSRRQHAETWLYWLVTTWQKWAICSGRERVRAYFIVLVDRNITCLLKGVQTGCVSQFEMVRRRPGGNCRALHRALNEPQVPGQFRANSIRLGLLEKKPQSWNRQKKHHDHIFIVFVNCLPPSNHHLK